MAEVTQSTGNRPALWKTIAAFAVIYIVWGSTFLAIRVGVQSAPPLLLAGVRFTIAGLLVLAYVVLRREQLPRGREWGSLAGLATLIFVLDYGLLFWAEQRVPSGIAAVLTATIPSFMVLAEIALLRTQRMTWRLGGALSLGLLGVAVLLTPSALLGSAAVDRAGAAALLAGAVFWSVASALIKRLPLPASKAVSSGTQMLLGGLALLLLSAVSGEFRGFQPSRAPASTWWALVYLIAAGSILGFTVYVWLIHHQSPTLVGTYAYVNPLVAVALGAVFLREALTARTMVGAACVLGSVIAMTIVQRLPPS